MTGSHWTPRENLILRKLWPTVVLHKQIAAHLGRPLTSVDSQARRIGLGSRNVLRAAEGVRLLARREFKL